jgi:hypothetical protein
MILRSAACSFVVVLCAAAPAHAGRPRRSIPPPTYERTLLPIFRARCLGCHAGSQARAGLDLRTRGDLLEGGHSGPGVVPGSPKDSLLYQTLLNGRMPPGGKMPPAELARVEAWIRAGAPGAPSAGHWAFRTPRAPVVPAVRGAARARNPIDRFLLSLLERKGLAFSPDADRRTLVRRVTYDLIGLPPSPAEVEDFVTDTRADAYERLVDRLLADPRYGERWARHWLDTAGYADSEGVLQEDRIRPNAWRYRDYVIRAFNEDRPYDRFVREQIAGDELVDYRNAGRYTPEIVESLTATGFLRTAVDATRDDFNPHQYGEYQYRMLHDTQTIVSSTVMGLAVQCTRCHSHKYEPLSQRDYYGLQALFAGAVRPRGTLLPSARRQVVAATAAEQKQAQETNARIDSILAALADKQAALLRDFRLRHLNDRLAAMPEAERAPIRAAADTPEVKRTADQKALVAKYAGLVEPPVELLAKGYPEFKQRRAELEQQREAEQAGRINLTTIRAFYDQDAAPPPTRMLLRGDWLRPGEPVEPAVPDVLARAFRPLGWSAPAPGAATTGRRRAFADWLADPRNPLTARVMVNRVWAHHFGAGIVSSVDNFGRSGAAPSHPELLDYLACYFTAGAAAPGPRGQALGSETPTGAWSVKRLHRLILTSSAYRQASAWREAAATVDPENRLLWRQRPRRLEAEVIRDAVLSVSAMLDPRMYGEPVPIEARPSGEIVANDEENRGRRSIYLLARRSLPVDLLNAFDAPVMETNCARRVTSTTATQALAQMNGTFITHQARHFARRILSEKVAPDWEADARRLEIAYLLALSRGPAPRERAAARQFLRDQTARYIAAQKTPGVSTELAWTDLCQALLTSNEFIYID